MTNEFYGCSFMEGTTGDGLRELVWSAVVARNAVPEACGFTELGLLLKSRGGKANHLGCESADLAHENHKPV
jgi:hypothetical protein